MTTKALAGKIIQCFENKGKLICLGNGGSMAQASHLAGEFLCRVRHDRTPLPAIPLSDSAVLSAIVNDYGQLYMFSRQVDALAAPQDLVIAFSTSGKSSNVLHALKLAREKGIQVIDWPRVGDNTQEIQEEQLRQSHEVAVLVEEYFT